MTPLTISPSLLSANPIDYTSAITECEASEADYLHIDVMDGHFVPNLTFGLPLIRALKAKTTLPLDVHLMISNPDERFQSYLDAGADILTFHLEASTHPHRTASAIRAQNKQAGIALNPHSPPELARELFPYVDLILVMSVNPGFGGQKFLEHIPTKIEQLHNMLKQRGLEQQVTIAVDGGIHTQTLPMCYKKGASRFVAGSSLFKQQPMTTAMQELRASVNSV
ncbi:MAG: ribulose-phosphate 3-epimerase [Zetaproteobacteria bacterium]|nr:ribulose-phosphate 3-epimerase [Zetaproteobacteria bacterium]